MHEVVKYTLVIAGLSLLAMVSWAPRSSFIPAQAQTITDYDAVLAPYPADSQAFCEAAPSCAALLQIHFNERFARALRAMQAIDANGN